jgi:GH25 family lysozyme M1 (1,4-beta-N-acetylmuramidase)
MKRKQVAFIWDMWKFYGKHILIYFSLDFLKISKMIDKRLISLHIKINKTKHQRKLKFREIKVQNDQ